MKSDSRYTIFDLEQLAIAKTAELGDLTKQNLTFLWPAGLEFREWEVEGFFAAYREHRLFELIARKGSPSRKHPNGCPRVDFAGDSMPIKPNGEPYVHEFLTAWRLPIVTLGPPEYLTQASAAGELVARYHQRPERLGFELPLVRDTSLAIRAGAYAIDLAIFDGHRPPHGDGKPVVGVPVKMSKQQHREMLDDFRRCQGGVQRCGENHRNCLWVRQNPTVKYIWVRSQDESDLFEVFRTTDGGFALSDRLTDSQRDTVLSEQNW